MKTVVCGANIVWRNKLCSAYALK